jgi:hypothetical protein
MKAASLGACAPIGCVTNINAYVMPNVTIKNTMAKTDPIRNINRALMSSWLNRSLFFEAITDHILCTGSRDFALWFLTFWVFPIFMLLAWIPHPSIVTTPGKA